MTRLALFLLLAVGAMVIPNAALAIDPPTRKVTVQGTAIIHVAPDEMHWTVTISIDDATLAKAKDRHDGALTAAIKYVKGLGSAVKDLQTGGINIQKNNFAPPDSAQAKTPYNCSTTFTFTLTDFDRYGAIADALAKLDGVQVGGVEYATSKEAELHRDALKRALLDAHDKANDLAVTANCYIDRPLNIEETNGTNVRPEMFNSAMATRSASAGTPGTVPGQIDISATVTVTYDMFYK